MESPTLAPTPSEAEADSTGNNVAADDDSDVLTTIIVGLLLSLITVVAVGARIIHKQRITAQAKEEQLREFERRLAGGSGQVPPTVYDTVDPAQKPPVCYEVAGSRTITLQGRALANPHYAIGGALGNLTQAPLAPNDTVVDEAGAAHASAGRKINSRQDHVLTATPQDQVVLTNPCHASGGMLGDRDQAESPTYATTPVVFDGSEADYRRQVDYYGEVGTEPSSTIYQVPMEDGADGVVQISDTDYIIVAGDTDAPTSVDRSGVLMQAPPTHKPSSMYVGGSTVARDPIDQVLVTATFVTSEAVYDIPMETRVKASAQTVVVTPGVQNLALTRTFDKYVYELDHVPPQGEVAGKRTKHNRNRYLSLLVDNTNC